jgi:hypothetical protein
MLGVISIDHLFVLLEVKMTFSSLKKIEHSFANVVGDVVWSLNATGMSARMVGKHQISVIWDLFYDLVAEHDYDLTLVVAFAVLDFQKYFRSSGQQRL